MVSAEIIKFDRFEVNLKIKSAGISRDGCTVWLVFAYWCTMTNSNILYYNQTITLGVTWKMVWLYAFIHVCLSSYCVQYVQMLYG